MVVTAARMADDPLPGASLFSRSLNPMRNLFLLSTVLVPKSWSRAPEAYFLTYHDIHVKSLWPDFIAVIFRYSADQDSGLKGPITRSKRESLASFMDKMINCLGVVEIQTKNDNFVEALNCWEIRVGNAHV